MGKWWRVVKEDGRRKEKAMDGTNKDCTSGQKTRCPSAIPDIFQSPLISMWHQPKEDHPRPEHEETKTAGDE